MEDCDDGDLAAFKVWLEDKKQYAPKTITFAFTAVRQFYFYWGRLKGFKVMNYELVTPPKGASRSYRPVKKEEFERMCQVIDPTNYRGLQELVILRLLWDGALRVSELCDLNLSDIDIQRRKMIVRNRKNPRHRITMWSEATHEYVVKYLGIRLALNSEPALFQGIFITEDFTTRMRVRTAQRIITRLSKRAGIEGKVSCHCLRHGKGHDMTRQKASLAIISKYFGHSTIESTKVYQQFEDPEFEKLVVEYI